MKGLTRPATNNERSHRSSANKADGFTGSPRWNQPQPNLVCNHVDCILLVHRGGHHHVAAARDSVDGDILNEDNLTYENAVADLFAVYGKESP